jgi:hypothetical protein
MKYGAQAPLLRHDPDPTLPSSFSTHASTVLKSVPTAQANGRQSSSYNHRPEPPVPTVSLPTSAATNVTTEIHCGEANSGVAESEQSLLWNIFTLGGLLANKWRSKPVTITCSGRPKPIPNDQQKNETLFNSNQADSPTHIPQYVLDYAPYCYLYSGEEYWPGKMEVHLDHTTPHVDYDEAPGEFLHPTLDDLDRLNYFGRNVFLQSHDDPETYPDWIAGSDNIPDDPNYRRKKGQSKQPKSKRTNIPYRSDAPVILVVVDKGAYVDAFWFFFYSFNLGNAVFGVRFGNHVGDWEHTAVRFENGKPIHVFYSEHEWGAAYNWKDSEKDGKRVSCAALSALVCKPLTIVQLITYSAFGTHAMYRTAGLHEYILPFGILRDITDRGVLWDPTLNMLAYTYDHNADIVRASDLTPDAPENWFYFGGHWGDKAYPMEDKRQYRLGSELHYVSGPTGPRFKNLGRKDICQNPAENSCQIRSNMEADLLPKVVVPQGNGTWKVYPLGNH